MDRTSFAWFTEDWLKWTAAGCALIATATAEHSLAVAVGMNEWVAVCVPGALDAYVVRALRAHREVLAAVLAMVGVNAASHLLSAGILEKDWRLITAVAAIAPLVLYRVHALGKSTDDGHVPDNEHDTDTDNGHGENARAWSVPDEHATDTPPFPHQLPRALGEHVTDTASTFDEHADAAVSAVMPDYVPDSWRREHDEKDACSACSGTVTYDEHDGWTHDDVSAVCVLNEHAPSTPVLRSVPALPAGFVPADTVDMTGVPADVLAVLVPGDFKYLGEARDADRRHRYEHSSPITVRALKDTVNVGTPRAQRLLAALRKEHAVQAQSTEGGHDDA